MKDNSFYDKFGDQVAEYRFNPNEYNRKRVIQLCKTALVKLDR